MANHMTDTTEKIDYSKTLYLPQTEFPMRAGLPEKEPLHGQALAGHGHVQAAARKTPPAAKNSCCMTARPTPTATSISGMR